MQSHWQRMRNGERRGLSDHRDQVGLESKSIIEMLVCLRGVEITSQVIPRAARLKGANRGIDHRLDEIATITTTIQKLPPESERNA